MMAITEADRYAMHTDLIQTIGEKAAQTLMEHLPPVGWADVATKHDLGELEKRIELRFEKVDERFKSVDKQFEYINTQITSFKYEFWAMSGLLFAASGGIIWTIIAKL